MLTSFVEELHRNILHVSRLSHQGNSDEENEDEIEAEASQLRDAMQK